jgi:hypothetical protein
MKIYLAGKWEEREKIASYAKVLEERGHSITFPWFTAHFDGSPLDQSAVDDARGVCAAEACIFIFENKLPYSGAMTELGMALGRTRILIVGNGGDSNVFTHLPSPMIQRVETFEEALECLN